MIPDSPDWVPVHPVQKMKTYTEQYCPWCNELIDLEIVANTRYYLCTCGQWRFEEDEWQFKRRPTRDEELTKIRVAAQEKLQDLYNQINDVKNDLT